MTRTIVATLVMAGAIASVMDVGPSAAADAGAAAPPFRVNCWIGMKFGDQPGQLIRGWTCDRHYPVPEAAQTSAQQDSQSPFADKQDVAAIGVGSHHR